MLKEQYDQTQAEYATIRRTANYSTIQLVKHFAQHSLNRLLARFARQFFHSTVRTSVV